MDGNKPTANTATGVFLLLNGFPLHLRHMEVYNWLIGSYETGRVKKALIEPWLREHAETL